MSYSFKHKFCHALTHAPSPPLFKMLCIQCQVLAFKTPRSNTATTVTMPHTIQLKETIYESHLILLFFLALVLKSDWHQQLYLESQFGSFNHLTHLSD